MASSFFPGTFGSQKIKTFPRTRLPRRSGGAASVCTWLARGAPCFGRAGWIVVTGLILRFSLTAGFSGPVAREPPRPLPRSTARHPGLRSSTARAPRPRRPRPSRLAPARPGDQLHGGDVDKEVLRLDSLRLIAKLGEDALPQVVRVIEGVALVDHGDPALAHA